MQSALISMTEGEFTRVASLLKGILEDDSHISFSIADFLDKKDRIRKSKSSVNDGLDREDKDYLIEFLNGKLHSEEF